MNQHHNRSSKVLWPVILGVVVTISLAVVLSQAGQSASPTPGGPAVASPSAQFTPTIPAATATPIPPASTTYVLPPTNTLAPTSDEQTTQAFLATLERSAGATHSFIETSLAATPSEPIPTGILDGAGVRADAHYLNVDAIFENMWRGELSGHGHGVNVYAGSSSSDPAQGLVAVMVEGPVITYLSPVKVGSLHIVAEQNLRLTLLSTNGTTLYFDVPGQEYVSSLTAIVPTVTPYQSPTPAPSPVPPTAPPVPTCTPGPTPSHATGESDCLATH